MAVEMGLPVGMVWFLPIGGFIAGLIDSIAGGGGLITLPLLIFYVGSNVSAVGTNKIVGFTGALIALWVYQRKGHLDFRKGIAFSVWVAMGAMVGSSVALLLPKAAFRWLIVGICPGLLYLIWRKDFLVREIQPPVRVRGVKSFFEPAVAVSGLACGFYDGVVGPGGGTLMFFSLLVFVKLPLLTSVAITKLANSLSAASALCRFLVADQVRWVPGIWMAAGVAMGAFLGAQLASEHAAKIVRPVFTLVVLLLIVRLILQARG